MKLDLHYFFIYRSILVCFMMILFSNLKAQNDRESEQKIITEIMERLIENAESTIDYTDIQDQLTFYINHKLNINTATRLDFQKLIFLEESSIDAIINHRLQFGNYLTVYELQSIETIDERTLYLLSYFIKIEEDFTQNKMSFFKMISLGKNVVTAIANTVGTHVQKCFTSEKNHSIALDALTEYDDIINYDFSVNWPDTNY